MCISIKSSSPEIYSFHIFYYSQCYNCFSIIDKALYSIFNKNYSFIWIQVKFIKLSHIRPLYIAYMQWSYCSCTYLCLGCRCINSCWCLITTIGNECHTRINIGQGHRRNICGTHQTIDNLFGLRQQQHWWHWQQFMVFVVFTYTFSIAAATVAVVAECLLIPYSWIHTLMSMVL